jgi:glycosyltransferase involved in cell wall biosynthesis
MDIGGPTCRAAAVIAPSVRIGIACPDYLLAMQLTWCCTISNPSLLPLPISVLLLARDEAERLEYLLPALSFARETVVVVDTSSRDNTAAVAAAHGARVVERALDGFGPQRQFGLAHCREEWVLWIDADERLDAQAVRAIGDALRIGEADGFRFQRRTWFLGRRIEYCGWQNERVLRLFRRARARFDTAALHERVLIEGTIADLPGVIEHHSYSSWEQCVAKLMAYSAAATNAKTGGRAGWLDIVLRPPFRFVRMYVLQLGFLDGVHGLVLCAFAATGVFLKYGARWANRLGSASATSRDESPRHDGEGRQAGSR